MIVALLAVMKAGGAYVPLDPGYPERSPRIHCRKPNPRWCWSTVVTQSVHEDELLEDNSLYKTSACDDYSVDAFLRGFDKPEKTQIKHMHQNPSIANLNRHLVYIIYTSGSTGCPKA